MGRNLYCERCNQIIPYDHEIGTDTGDLCQTCAEVLLRERAAEIVRLYEVLDKLKKTIEGGD